MSVDWPIRLTNDLWHKRGDRVLHMCYLLSQVLSETFNPDATQPSLHVCSAPLVGSVPAATCETPTTLRYQGMLLPTLRYH